MNIVIDKAPSCGQVTFHIEEGGKRMLQNFTKVRALVNPELTEPGNEDELKAELLARVMNRAKLEAISKMDPAAREERKRQLALERSRRRGSRKAWRDQYRKTHREKILMIGKKADEKRKHDPKRKAYWAEWRAKNREKTRTMARYYYAVRKQRREQK